MTTFEQILHKIEDWDLDGANRDLQSQLELSDAEIRRLDLIYREYCDVDENIQSLRKDLTTKPDAVLHDLAQLSDIKVTHPEYQRLLGQATERSSGNRRASILEEINKAEELSRQARSYAEAQQLLLSIQAEYPNWAADPEISERIHQVDNEAKKAEKANILHVAIQQNIKSGKPDEGNELLTQLELLDKLDDDEIIKLRSQLLRLAAHKHARSSKETHDFSEGDDEFDFEISKVERSVNSIQNTSSYSYRLLYNNEILRESLYSNAITKLGQRRIETAKKIEELGSLLKGEDNEDRKNELGEEILSLRESLETLQERLDLLDAKRREVNESLPKTEAEARKQTEKIVNDALDSAEQALQAGKLEIALFFIETANKAGVKEEYDDPRLTDHLGTVPLSPEQAQRAIRLQSDIQDRQKKRQEAQVKKEVALRQLSVPVLTLPQLRGILSELQEARDLDKNTPGLLNAIQNIEERIAREAQLQKEQCKLRVTLLCRKGLVDEAQRAVAQAVDTLGNDLEIQNLQDEITKTQEKIQHLERVAEDFHAGFRITRDELILPDDNLHALLDEWKREGFDTARISSADAQFNRYINGLSEVKKQAECLEQGLQSGDPLTSLREVVEYLRHCFLKSEARIQELLARYWHAVANQYKDKDELKEEEYLQDALVYAENSKNPNLVLKINTRLGELQSQTDLGRRARTLEETLTRYKDTDLPRALEKIAELSPDDPLRNYPRVAHAIDDIEYRGKYQRAQDRYQNARDQFRQGEYAAALIGARQALDVLPSYFEAVQLEGEIKVAQADEEPLVKKIQDALAISAETDKALTGSQVKQLEESKFLVNQLDNKMRVSMSLLAQKNQFLAYYQSWHDKVAGIVQTGVESAQLQLNAGDFDAASQILTDLREQGIPFDLLASISQAENRIKAYRSQSMIINRMIDAASEMASEGKYGIEKALTSLTSLKSAPSFLRPTIDKRVEFFKQAQNDFGKITEDISKNKAMDIVHLLEANRRANGKIDLNDSLDSVRKYGNELQNSINSLKEIGIKETNDVLKAAVQLQKIAQWYATSVDIVEKEPQGQNYGDVASLIKLQEQAGEAIKQELSPFLPHAQAVQSSIDSHISFLGKIRQNNEIFADVYRELSTHRNVGRPNKGYWQSLRHRASSRAEGLYVGADEKKINELISLIDEKESRSSRNFAFVVYPLGVILLCIFLGSLGAAWKNYIGPTYFPTPTNTLAPTNTPLPTVTPSITPVPSITPRPTITLTPTPLPLLVRIVWKDGAPVYLYPGIFQQIYKFASGDDVYIQSYCIKETEYWGRVLTPDDYGWILMARYDAGEYYDFVNADIQAGLRKKALNVIMDNHPELLVSCPAPE